MLFICCSFLLLSCFSALFRWWRYEKFSVSLRARELHRHFLLQPESRPYASHERMERSKNHRLDVYTSFIRTLKRALLLPSLDTGPVLVCERDGETWKILKISPTSDRVHSDYQKEFTHIKLLFFVTRFDVITAMHSFSLLSGAHVRSSYARLQSAL